MARRGPIPPSWQVPAQHAYQHAYWQPHAAFYPGATQPGASPRWVGAAQPLGPAFAATQPTAKKRGCVSAFLGCAAIVGGAIVLLVVVIVVVMASVDTSKPTSKPHPTVQPPPLDPPNDQVPRGVIPGALPVMTGTDVDQGLHTGKCSTNDEERQQADYYIGFRGAGSAGHLVGRVALVHLRMEARGASFSGATARSVAVSAAISRQFFLDQAKRWSVPGLNADVIVWPISTPFALPMPRLDARRRIDNASAGELDQAVRLAVESAAGKRLDQVVIELKQRGYQHVAFLVHFPTGPLQIRDFAHPAQAGDDAEMAFMVAPKWAPGERGAIASHEMLHLFGAYDLYKLKRIGADENGEVMNSYCHGLGSTSIGPGTAYAIGWGNPPTDRPYRFVARPRDIK